LLRFSSELRGCFDEFRNEFPNGDFPHGLFEEEFFQVVARDGFETREGQEEFSEADFVERGFSVAVLLEHEHGLVLEELDPETGRQTWRFCNTTEDPLK